MSNITPPIQAHSGTRNTNMLMLCIKAENWKPTKTYHHGSNNNNIKDYTHHACFMCGKKMLVFYEYMLHNFFMRFYNNVTDT